MKDKMMKIVLQKPTVPLLIGILCLCISMETNGDRVGPWKCDELDEKVQIENVNEDLIMEEGVKDDVRNLHP